MTREGRRPTAGALPSRGSAARRKRVRDRALTEVRGCLRDWDDGREAAREAKAVAETIISPEYEGRVLIELLQNAHDAHPARAADGRVEIVLDDDEGEHGTLYVANRGKPFGGGDFKALCSIALSSKRADEGIGHKGVGFKSVLHLCDAPEVYSVAQAGARAFDGFTFRFALLDDFDALAAEVAPERPGFAAYLRQNLLRLKVPVFLEEAPPAARRFARRGFVTVVRLPLKSADARSAAGAQLQELMDDAAPFELFLDRLRRVTLTRKTAGRTRSKTCEREVETLHSSRGLKVQRVTLRRRKQLIVVCGKADANRARDAIATSIEKRMMRHDWAAWEKKAEVRVAVPVGDPLESGRLYTFLPMAEQIPAPVRGYVHAPFLAEMNRRSFNEAVPWNGLLLDTLAELCAKAALAAAEGRVQIPPGALVDLMCWRRDALRRLVSAFQALDGDLDDVPFIPVLGTRPDARTSLARAALWNPGSAALAFTPHAVAATGVTDLTDPDLHPGRLRRLTDLAGARGRRLEPPARLLADWAQRLALAAGRGAFAPGWWADFYHDLSQLFPDGSALKGKRIVLSTTMTLAPAGGEGVFLDRGTTESGALPPPPDGLSDRLFFVHESIDWTGKRRKRRTQARNWLRAVNLVHDYGAERVLDVVASVLSGDDEDGDVRLRWLRYACVVSHALERGGRRPPVLPKLRVPTRSGWCDANRAMFGPGWPGDHASVDDTLTRFLDSVLGLSAVLATTAGRLLEDPGHLCADTGIPVDAMRRFLERHGVFHGLRPRYESFTGEIKGEALNRPGWFWCRTPDSGAVRLSQWRATAERWPTRRRVTYTSVEYRPRTPQAVLPGQNDYPAFSDEDRRRYAELIVHGLATWPDTALQMRFIRHSDSSGTLWPTPLSVFLAHEAWIPQTPAPGGTAGPTFATKDTAWWWLGTHTPPAFLTVAPATLRRRQSGRLPERLSLLGIRSWDDPRTAAARLRHLPDLVHTGPHLREGRLAHEIRREYERAWAQLCPPDDGAPGAEIPLRTAPERLVVTRAGVLETLGADAAGEPLFVPDPDGAQNRALLDRVAVPVLPVGDKALGGRIHACLQQTSAFDARRCADAEHDIQTDRLPVREAPRTPLPEYAGPWLRTLVAALVEFDEERALRPEPVPVTDIDGLLRSCDVTVAGEAVVWIAGHRLTENGADRALLHPHPDRPRIVVVHTGHRTRWRVVRNAAPAVASLIGAPYLEGSLWAALTKLEERGLDVRHVADEDIAAVLDIRPHQLEAVLADRASQRSGSARIIPLLACLDLDLAEELQQRVEDFSDRAAFLTWLAEEIGTENAGLLVRLLEESDQERQLSALSVSLADANRAWRTLGLPGTDNRESHERQFAAWLQRNRTAVTTRVRDAHADAYRSGRSLTGYVRLRSLPGLAPDPAWHTTRWNLSDALLRSHADTWAHAQLPATPAVPARLRPLADVREASSATVHKLLPRLRQLIAEWTQLHCAGRYAAMTDAQDILRELDGEGLLDFETLTAKPLLHWLKTHGYWPEGMPLSDRRADLGLGRTHQPGTPTGSGGAGGSPSGGPGPGPEVQLNGRSLSARRDDLPALAREVTADLTAEQRATPARSPKRLAPRIPRPRTPSGGGSWSGAFRASTADPDRTAAIGLAGEAVVAAWLHEQFGVAPQDSWRSGLRVHGLAGGEQGDDRLGYDFVIHDGDRTYYYEVKASVGDSGEIILGESEVRHASQLKPGETYFLVYVSHVLDRTRRRISVLPNPFSAPDLAGYELVSTQMRLRFDVGTDRP
ncbi:sacsin N-terminal ATP-binding-like domain-containing protein [Streptomyces sp. NPDC048644]|uniref:sacsin N-terminal ATP-binding-like domain-containing protein n=1 Tax=Streptomyces sp. NPDC048644 TaxID=3365582 RepID=UPI00371AA705